MPVTGALQVAIFVGGFMVLYPSLLTRRSILALFAYGIVMFVYFLFGNKFFPAINNVVIPFLFMMSGLLIAEYTLKYDHDYRYTRLVLITVFVCDLLMAAITIPQFTINPNIVYGSVVNSEMSDLERQLYSFVISYETIHGIALIMAPLTFICKKMLKKNKVLSLLMSAGIVILLYVVYKSNGTTAMLMSLLMAGVGLVVNIEKFKRKSIPRFVFVGLLGFILIQPGVIVPILKTMQSTMETNSGNYIKLGEVQDRILFDESGGDLGYREELYQSSVDLFIESPIWGTSTPEKIGQHSYIRDRLALFGILFIIPLVLIFVCHYRSIYLNLRHTRVIYAFSITGMLFMLFMKNEFGQGTWLYGFAYLPLMCRYADYVIDNNGVKNRK